MNTPLNVRRLETEIAAKVADIGSRNEEEIRVVQSGLEVFHGVQRERDAQAARASDLATKLAVAGTEIELLRKQLAHYKRKAEHFERTNISVNTRLAVLFESIREVVAVSNAHGYGDRPLTGAKLASINTDDVPAFLRGPQQKVESR